MRRLGPITLALLLALTACAGPTSATDPGNLAGTSWVVTQIKSSPTIANHQPTIEFSTTTLAGSASCNGFTAGYTKSGVGISISPLAITEIACSPQAVMDQETEFSAALGKVAKLAGGATDIELQDVSGQSLLTLTKAAAEPPPSPLAGTSWSLTSIRTGTTASSLVAGSSVTLQINGTRFSGKACNNFGGDVRIDGNKFKVTSLMTTKMACKAALDKQESTVLGTLHNVETMSIKGTQLSLSAPDGSGLDFTAK